jgi:hypothetical protein
MECTVENNKLIPLSKVVAASIIDVYGDIGMLEQRYSHWAARGLKKLYRESLPQKVHKVLLKVNVNTHTATLPLDFYNEIFTGYIGHNWHKVRLSPDTSLVDQKNIIDVPCEDKCEKCNQDKGVCNDLVVTEETNLIVINDTTYEQTIIKKLYPNGDYYLEKSTPVLNISTNTVQYVPEKEFIVNFDLKPCGCLEESNSNMTNLQTYCPDVYCNYYAPCNNICNKEFSYNIFEDTGLIQLDARFPYDKIYLEYSGYIQKKNGQYMVPDVAFEALVEWNKYKAIWNKNNVSRWERQDQKNNYREERGNMQKILGRVRLSTLISAWNSLPKFDIDYKNWSSCFSLPANFQVSNTVISTNGNGNGSSVTEIINNTTIINRTAFVLSVKVDGQTGHPVAGQSTYQNNILRNATDLEYLFLAKQTFTKLDGDFTFDATTGTISIYPNVFTEGDSLIANYNKNS